MNEDLARRIMVAAFNDELEKISSQRHAVEVEKWASATFNDWDDLNDMQKQAFIGKMVKSVGKAFGIGRGSAAKSVAQKAKPLVDFSGAGKALPGTAALRGGKHIPRVGNFQRR